MAEKTLSTRIIHKHDVESNWLLATNFIPKQGELIVYDIDSNYSYERLKIGDGVKNVNALPFATDALHKSEVFFYASEINFVDANTYVTLDDYNLVPTNKQINVGDFIISNSKVYKTVEVESGTPTGEYSIKIAYMLDIDLSGSNNIFYAPRISTTATRQGDVGFARAEIIPSDKEIKIGDIVIANSQVYQVVYLGKNILADIEADCLFNIDNTIPNFATIDGSTLKMQRTDGATTTDLFEVELPSTPVDDTLTESGKAADAKATGDAISNLNTLVGDTAVSEQIATAIDESTADDFGIYVQASEPTEAVAGDIWIDTINDPSYIPPTLPEITQADNGKVLMVVNGKLQLVNLNLTTDANGVLSI